ncbi:branched-chain amino acid transport system II carrier protein [Chryseobacterium sp. HSC-36S06]|uniref:branched-chain amino acid transport system II carrier protein n=1 Tax=Chryseobacterium sp. HSC-36S06 TaxID=2910970 RepID=UPI00209FBC2D|nr:branched-chain amino acid transport system II carrier protein [Chryseobacterium sp. HSC-36S06]MCP2037592.1 LIVCS family branched-chain amino acid:cation transporter [Chryseobacterium sp. HSC-36S06]
MKNKLGTAITLGFALFAMFFGAGNLILPPFIGLKSGTEWFAAVTGFFTTGIVAPFLGVLTVVLFGTSFTDLGRKVNPLVVTVLAFLIMLCIGPLVAIPRTAAATFEIGIQPLFPDFNNILFSVLFFGVVIFLSVSKSRIVDIIGNFLTPFLILSLGILVVMGIINPPDVSHISELNSQQSFVFAFHEGYQTLDVLASVIFAGIIISAAIDKGYTNANDRFKITIAAGLISMIALLFIYGGLIYLGAHSGFPLSETVSRTELLLHISNVVLGNNGTVVISFAVALACLTTAIALTSAMGSFLEKLTFGKINYKMGVLLTCLVSGYFSVKSVEEIIDYAVVILGFIYPITFALILTVLFFGKLIFSRAPFIAAVTVAALVASLSVFQHFNLFPQSIAQINSWLPLSQHQLGWLLPSFLAFFIAAGFNSGRKKTSRQN